MAIVVPAEGIILERVLDATQKKTAWGRHHLRRYALVEGGDVLASATQGGLFAVLDKRPVRVCGIGEIFTQPGRGGGPLRELVERLLDQAAREGAVMAIFFSVMSHEYQPTGFDVVAMIEAELRVCGIVSSRRPHDPDPWR